MSQSVLRSFRPLFDTLSALALGKKAASAAELRPLRAELKKQLLALKQELAGQLSEHEVYLMLFAPVVHADELVRTSFPEADHVTWPLLQKELFDVDRGGELFYQSVGELVDGPKLAPVVYNVYYFCLSLGFRGKFAQEPEKRAQIMTRLRERLANTAPANVMVDLAVEQPEPRLPRIRSIAWPWAGAGAIVVAMWLAFSALAGATVARWRAAESPSLPSSRGAVEACIGGAPCRSS